MAACVQFQDESVDDEQRPALLHDLYKRFFARDALTPLAGADPAAIASYLMKAASSGTPIHADVLEPVWDWLRATMQGCFEELRRTKPFHHYMKCELASAELPIDPKQASFPNDIELEMPSLVLTLPSSSTTGHHHPPITVGFPHELNTLTIGRDYSCDVLVQESADVSRSHARFGYTRTNVDVFDLGSSSGTFVNGSRVHYAPVSLNDTVRIGNMTFVLRLSHVEPKQNIGQKIVNTFRRLSLKLSGTAATSPAPQSQ
ncbi:hypothetical protein PBRA_000206 [Plasmodiophora brassicae]|nr:hypothetical protein PBRA_000206 [Plasmodiophora brassicae]